MAAYQGRGYAYLNLSKYDLAAADFQRAIDLDPDLAAAYYNRGLARAMLGDSQGAMADMDVALSRADDPDNWAQDAVEDLQELKLITNDPNTAAQLDQIIERLRSR